MVWSTKYLNSMCLVGKPVLLLKTLLSFPINAVAVAILMRISDLNVPSLDRIAPYLKFDTTSSSSPFMVTLTLMLFLLFSMIFGPFYTYVDSKAASCSASPRATTNVIRHQTGGNDIVDVIKKGIHGWAGHIARFKYNRWTKIVTEWTPQEWTRRQERPKTRWRDNLIRYLGPGWPRIARDQRLRRQFRERFLLTEWKKPSSRLLRIPRLWDGRREPG